MRVNLMECTKVGFICLGEHDMKFPFDTKTSVDRGHVRLRWVELGASTLWHFGIVSSLKNAKEMTGFSRQGTKKRPLWSAFLNCIF